MIRTQKSILVIGYIFQAALTSIFFFRMAYLNAWLMWFVGYTLLCSLLGWTTRGRHHTPVSRMFDWPLHRDFSLLFAIGEVGSFTCIGCDSPIHGTDGLKSPPKDLAMRIKRLAKGRYCRGGIWTHAEPPVLKFAVYRLALRPLGHDSSSLTSIVHNIHLWGVGFSLPSYLTY